MEGVVVTSEPKDALVDQVVRLNVRNLPAHQPITIHHLIEHEKKRFVAHAHYVADGDGMVDLTRHPSLGGSYTEVKAMGLFSHMEQMRGQRKGLRLMQKNVEQPIRSSISVLPHHLNHSQLYPQDGEICITDAVAEHEISRYYMGPDVIRQDVRVGKIRGALFLPKGKGPFPGVIDMFGTVGGLTQFRSALLASHGFASLALAYFNYEDLPGTFDCDLNYFEEASRWLSEHESVLPGGIGCVGVSRGAELAADMFTFFHQYIKAAICINGNYFFWRVSYNGTPLGLKENVDVIQSEFMAWRVVDDALTFLPDESQLKFLGAEYDDEYKHLFIPVERGTGHIMFVVGTADACCPALQMAERAERRMVAANKQDQCQLLTYQDAGHLIEPPYAPLCALAFHPPFNNLMWFGGEVEGHAIAQEDSWRRMLAFLRENLLPHHHMAHSSRTDSKL